LIFKVPRIMLMVLSTKGHACTLETMEGKIDNFWKKYKFGQYCYFLLIICIHENITCLINYPALLVYLHCRNMVIPVYSLNCHMHLNNMNVLISWKTVLRLWTGPNRRRWSHAVVDFVLVSAFIYIYIYIYINQW